MMPRLFTPMLWLVLLLVASPALAQTLLTDFQVRVEPALPTMGPRGSKIVDPTFGTTILRVTDSNDGPLGQTLYSTYPSVNVNSTRVVGVVLSGYYKPKFWVLDPVTFTVSGGTLPSNAPAFGYAVKWSGTNPDVVYGVGGTAKVLYSFNVATNTAAVLKDFTSVIGATEKISQHQHDLADNIFSMNIVNASGTPIGYILWRRSDNTTLLNVLAATTNETNVDKSGRYFFWQDTSCQDHVYDLNSGSAVFVASTSGSTAFCHNGTGVGTVFSDYSGGMGIRSLATPNTVTQLMAGYFGFATHSHHQSFNATNEAYGLVSRVCNQPGTCLVQAAFDGELLQVATSGNAVRRIAHHRSKTGPTQGGGYYDIPFANISPDGKFVAFTSNWGQSLGSNRHDLFLVQIPQASVDTAPPSTPVASVSVTSPTTITVNWTAATDNVGVAGYNIKRCTPSPCTPTVILATVSGSTLSYPNTGLTASTGYSYSVNAFDGAIPANQGAYSTAVSGTTSSTYRNVLAFDDFNRADGADLGAAWDAGYTAINALKIVSQRVLPTVLSVNSAESYNVVSPNNQFIQATLSVYVPASTSASLMVRLANPATFSGYECRIVTSGTVADIVEWTAGTGAVIATASVSATAQGDKLRCEAEGTALRFYRIRAGVETLLVSMTDASFATGKVGLKNFQSTDLTNAQFDDVIIGGFSATPDVAPSVTAATADATGANVTSVNSPTTIRVATNQTSVVEPIANFPGGRYTRTWVIGDTTVSFYARDITGAENQTQFATVSLVGIAPVADTTPPTLSTLTPSTDLPVGTTSTTISGVADETATCLYAATNMTYAAMSDPNEIASHTMAVSSLTHSVSVSGLTNGSSTSFYIRCQDSAGNANTSSFVITVVVASSSADTTLPSTVTNLACAALGQSQAPCTWTAATDNVLVSGYQLYLCAGDGCTVYNLAGQPVAATSTIVSLSGGTVYSMVVRAIDSSNNLSAADSNVATVTTESGVDVVPPSTPTGLTLIVFSRSMRLSWPQGTDNVGIITTIVERCTGAACSNFVAVGNSALSWLLDLSLTPGTLYRYRIKYGDAAGNVSTAYSTITEATTRTSGLGLDRPRLNGPRPTLSLGRGTRE